MQPIASLIESSERFKGDDDASFGGDTEVLDVGVSGVGGVALSDEDEALGEGVVNVRLGVRGWGAELPVILSVETSF